jgi:hypothetical protein
VIPGGARERGPDRPETRVVVVLGYSNGAGAGLHPICAARLRHAAEIAMPSDVVVLSGWARAPGTRSEAELMRAAWTGNAAQVVVDPTARTTVENAINALDDVRRARPGEVVVVTSRWHAPRARAAFRLVVRTRAVRVRAAWPEGTAPRGARLRELMLWPLLPLQVIRAIAMSRRRMRT